MSDGSGFFPMDFSGSGGYVQDVKGMEFMPANDTVQSDTTITASTEGISDL